MSGCPSGGSISAYYLRIEISGTYPSDIGSGIAVNGKLSSIWIGVVSGNVAPSGVWYPQIESGNAKTTFEPYTNECPITGLTECVVDVKDEEETTQDTATINFGQTVYGGSVDFKTGSGETTYGSVTVTEFLGKDGSTHNNYYFSVPNAKLPAANTDIVDVSSNMFASGYSYEQMYRADTGGVSITTSGLCVVSFGADSEINTLALANAWLAENSLQVVYELATPTELTLTPAELELLKGYNYITTNGTTITLDYLPDSLLAEAENYVDTKIPPAPTTDGTYVLTCTVTDGTPAYSWESAT
jgi:hypothetical protein